MPSGLPVRRMQTGDLPDGTGTTVGGNENGLFTTWLSAVPVGGSPTGAGESPAPPIFNTRFQTLRASAKGAPIADEEREALPGSHSRDGKLGHEA